VKEQARAQGSKTQVRQTPRDKQGEGGRRPTGKGLPCKTGMRTKCKNHLPRANLVTHLDRITSYGGASVRVGWPSDTLGTAVPINMYLLYNYLVPILYLLCVFFIDPLTEA
jgi:hypothetical protein